MNVPSKPQLNMFLKHIKALSTVLLIVLIKCHCLIIEYYFSSVIFETSTFTCGCMHRSKALLEFLTKVLIEMSLSEPKL